MARPPEVSPIACCNVARRKFAPWMLDRANWRGNFSQDDRVVVMEKINARNLKPEQFPAPADLAVIDCSFISLKKILRLPPCRLLKPDGRIVAMSQAAV